MDEVIVGLEPKLKDLVDQFKGEIAKLRGGQAHPSLLDGIMVEVYETKLPLAQVGSIVAPEASLLKVTPFEADNIEPIVAAINASQLDFNPTDDGRCVYIPVPPLTTERRQLILKNLGQIREDFLVRLRRVRHEALDELKEKLTSKDELHRAQVELEKTIGQTKDSLVDLAAAKQNEIGSTT